MADLPHKTISDLTIAKDGPSRWYLDRIADNIFEATKTYQRSFYLMAVVLVVHFLVIDRSLRDVTIFSIDLPRSNIIYWFMSLLESFLFYQAISAFAFERYSQELIHQALERDLPHISLRYSLDFLVFPPTFFNLERFLHQYTEKKYFFKATRLFRFVLIFVTTILPITMIPLGFCLNFQDFLSSEPKSVPAILIGILALVIFVRAFIIITQFNLDDATKEKGAKKENAG